MRNQFALPGFGDDSGPGEIRARIGLAEVTPIDAREILTRTSGLATVKHSA